MNLETHLESLLRRVEGARGYERADLEYVIDVVRRKLA